MQLVARFDLETAPETVALCRSLSPEGIAPDCIFGEWRKLLLRGEKISKGLAFLKECGWLPHYPELTALVGCPQDPKWHPEGDVWVHTLHSMDAFARERVGDDHEDLIVGLAVLCHDLGKPATTVTEEGGAMTSKRHEPVGKEFSRTFLELMTRDTELLREVPRLAASHLAPSQFYRESQRWRDTAARPAGWEHRVAHSRGRRRLLGAAPTTAETLRSGRVVTRARKAA
jgi:tRNA nucleotidyltransferase (CCA-adding enzyme)